MPKNRNARRLKVIPSAKRLVQSLRHVGYDFPQAVADIVDNSVAANASQVQIVVHFDGNDSWVRIADDGTGMVGSAVTEAMRYGANNRRYEADDLGKFGLGLKTASMSQCRVLTVASRTERARNRVEVRQLDLDHVIEADDWEVLDLGPDERDENVVLPLQDRPGTVVMWQNLDRVLEYKNLYSKHAENGLLRRTERLEQHLGMVFHRFLAGEVRRRKKLSMTINAQAVEPWDPFARDEKHTKTLTVEEIPITTDEGKGVVTYRPYVLPPKDKYSSEGAFVRLAGPNRWNQQQGFYIYRAGRMIQSGGWCGMRAADEHTKYARVALEFQPDLDSAFEVNVAKVRVGLPPELREKLREPTERLCKAAKEAYKKEQIPKSTFLMPEPRHQHAHEVARNGRDVVDAETPVARSTSTPFPSTGAAPRSEKTGQVALTIRQALEQAALAAGEERSLARIVKHLRKQNAPLARDLGW